MPRTTTAAPAAPAPAPAVPATPAPTSGALTGTAGDERGAIELRGIWKWFGDPSAPVLRDVSFRIPAGSFVSVIGASGCGKSTMLRMMGDLARPSRGEVRTGGHPVSQARQAHEIGFVFQAANLCAWRSVRRNVELPLEAMKVGRAERRERALAELDRVGLAAAVNQYPAELSGGMAQRVAIARSLVTEPPIVLMDEPFGALDEITRDRLNLDLHGLWRRTAKTIVFVTHSIPEAVLLSTQVVVMGRRPGRIDRTIDITLPDERTAETSRIPEFFEAVTEVRDALFDVMGRDL
ncbi:NitT/TauT family transport system ATP-binding protein [Parafrankia irregularis]|uniref:NitT/TauT family transport system ATP-binding protein n=1 Tax=Parafrankia irregularis TaxID=795642 RepID=A0A0S4QHT5_9ACTN|nr:MULTISPECIES: ABC transporter ATP-binding protein [Parafrankia]MBE3200958.1 ABC transporter ATP-binding protein [Parafrankia sp. CH37]CUU54642.1 NitT/TauT family transport system ATP-binding protein [Parafrankia irregularis]